MYEVDRINNVDEIDINRIFLRERKKHKCNYVFIGCVSLFSYSRTVCKKMHGSVGPQNKVLPAAISHCVHPQKSLDFEI